MEEDLKKVISEVIEEFSSRNNRTIKFKKPETIQGWLVLIITFFSIIGFMFTSIVFLNDISNHHKIPSHDGTNKILKELNKNLNDHRTDTAIHRNDDVLKLKIMQETQPIIKEIGEVKEDVRSIETKVDILLNREFERGHSEGN